MWTMSINPDVLPTKFVVFYCGKSLLVFLALACCFLYFSFYVKCFAEYFWENVFFFCFSPFYDYDPLHFYNPFICVLQNNTWNHIQVYLHMYIRLNIIGQRRYIHLPAKIGLFHSSLAIVVIFFSTLQHQLNWFELNNNTFFWENFIKQKYDVIVFYFLSFICLDKIWKSCLINRRPENEKKILFYFRLKSFSNFTKIERRKRIRKT